MLAPHSGVAGCSPAAFYLGARRGGVSHHGVPQEKERRSMGKLPFLLEAGVYSCELPGESVDFQSWASKTFGGRFDAGTAGAPWLLILTRADDREADRVGLRLAARGFSYRRIDADSLSAVGLTLGMDPGGANSRLRFGDEALCPPGLVWLRHFDPSAVRAPTADAVAGAYARSEWEHAVRSLLSLEGPGWINRPDAVSALGRVPQLRLADRVGLAVPKTLVTNDPHEVRNFVLSNPRGVVVKVLGDHFVEPEPGKLYGVFPRRITVADLDRVGCARLAPSVYQEYVPHVTEVRATVVGAEVVSAEISKAAPIDVWERPEEISVRPHDLPEQLRRKLVRYLELAGLEYGAFDLLLTEDGRYVFLEVNAIGDWAWLESKNDAIRVTDQMVSYITGILEEGRQCA